MLALYGHLFSSYTWKALIALYANGTEFEFRPLDQEHPDNGTFVAAASPQGLFPVLVDGATTVSEASSIIEYLHLNHRGPAPLLPDDPAAAIRTRMVDRMFDNYVMGIMQQSVFEAIRTQGNPDPEVLAMVAAKLERSYAWLDNWLADHSLSDHVTLIECAAAPSLFYADWVHQIPEQYARLRGYRAHLLALPPVKRCVDDARQFRHYFPLGAPDRD
ncbi:MAG: glutathione S-transferase family protein [Novosphingobium sp.]